VAARAALIVFCGIVLGTSDGFAAEARAMRRAEIGHHHHISGQYLLRNAQEASWREDSRRQPNGEQVSQLAGLALESKPSVDFGGYWQRHQPAA
jgi:hypothetical protein